LSEKILFSDIRVEVIHEKHNVKTFQSHEFDLVDFLQKNALDHRNKKFSVTFLWFYNSYLVSYITLLTDRIRLQGNLKLTFQEKGVYYPSLPALKIGRLCVHDTYQRKGLGTMMIYFAIEKAMEIVRDKAGCRFLTVDSKENAVGFYEYFGFRILKRKANGTVIMYLDLLSL
jgi:GNAT superfamily N-acetyltransferase